MKKNALFMVLCHEKTASSDGTGHGSRPRGRARATPAPDDAGLDWTGRDRIGLDWTGR